MNINTNVIERDLSIEMTSDISYNRLSCFNDNTMNEIINELSIVFRLKNIQLFFIHRIYILYYSLINMTNMSTYLVYVLTY